MLPKIYPGPIMTFGPDNRTQLEKLEYEQRVLNTRRRLVLDDIEKRIQEEIINI